jgi:hypothetical protein
MFLGAHRELITLVVGIGARHGVYEYPMWPFMGIGVHGNLGYGVYLRFVNPMVGYRCHDALPMFEASVFLN